MGKPATSNAENDHEHKPQRPGKHSAVLMPSFGASCVIAECSPLIPMPRNKQQTSNMPHSTRLLDTSYEFHHILQGIDKLWARLFRGTRFPSSQGDGRHG
jgi:hypothetical protein